MAEVFLNPFKLIFTVGKNLILNGVDIFDKINAGIKAYNAGDFYNFGKSMGDAMSEVFLKAPLPKSPMDQKAYDFISGFYSSIGANSILDQK